MSDPLTRTELLAALGIAIARADRNAVSRDRLTSAVGYAVGDAFRIVRAELSVPVPRERAALLVAENHLAEVEFRRRLGRSVPADADLEAALGAVQTARAAWQSARAVDADEAG